MTRRFKEASTTFLAATSLMFSGCATPVAISETASSPVPSNQLIVNARLIDGTGAPARQVDIRLSGNRIMEIGDLEPQAGEGVIDAHAMVVAPGFIDCHSHLDRVIIDQPAPAAALTQGITTVVFGVDGFSHHPLSEFFEQLEALSLGVNIASYSGHNTLRALAMAEGDRQRTANAEERLSMATMLRDDIAAGAVGLNSGLGYETGTFSDTEEVTALNSAATGTLYSSHIRNEGDEVLSAVDEAIEIARGGGTAGHISHIKIGARALWGRAGEMIAQLEAARDAGVEMTADAYPYTYWRTTMRILFPEKRFDDPSGPAMIFRDNVSPDDVIIQHFAPQPALEGRTIADIAGERGMEAPALYVQLMQQVLSYEAAHPTEERVEWIIGGGMSEQDLETFLRWPHTSICSDGSDGGHPRSYGTFTRILSDYVRDGHVLTLEDAVRRMTSLNAHNMGLADRGVIRPGAYADIVIFDPATVDDRATIADPRAHSVGIARVLVNGRTVYRNGEITEARPGMVVRRVRQD